MKVHFCGSSKRWDTKWYGFGYMKSVYVDNLGLPGKQFFLNSYRSAPIHIRTIDCCGYFKQLPSYLKVKHIFFTGSRKEPHYSWRFRLGRFFVGGRTPKCLIKLHEHLSYKKAVHQAKQTGEGLCPKCKNGFVQWVDGYPGEIIQVCMTCHTIFDSSFDESTIV